MIKATIERVENGYIVSYEDERAEGTPCTVSEVIEDSESDPLKSGEGLLWWVAEFFGVGGSKHDEERIRIVRITRDGEVKE